MPTERSSLTESQLQNILDIARLHPKGNDRIISGLESLLARIRRDREGVQRSKARYAQSHLHTVA